MNNCIVNKCQQITSGLASCGVYARGKFSGKFESLLPVRAFAFPRPNAKPPQRCAQARLTCGHESEVQQKGKTCEAVVAGVNLMKIILWYSTVMLAEQS